MAKPTKVSLKGKVGNLIFYEHRGIPCVRTMPSKVKQTKATKASAKLFGLATSMSASLRSGLDRFLPEDKGRKIMYRLNTALLQWVKQYEPEAKDLSANLKEVNGFQFSEDSSIFLRLRVRVKVDWNQGDRLVIHIPALVPARDIAAPAQTQTVHWNIAVAGCTVSNPSMPSQQAEADFEIPYNQDPLDARRIEFPFKVNRGELAVVAVSLQYRIARGSGLTEVTNPKWTPSGIVGSAYSR